MQILLHSDTNTDGGHRVAEHLHVVVQDAMGRFGEHVTRVEAHLADANGHAKAGDDAVQCTLEARLAGLDVVVVKELAGSVHQAIDGAVRKLQRAVGTEIARHDPRSQRGHPADADAAGSAAGAD